MQKPQQWNMEKKTGLGLIAIHLWRFMCVAIDKHFALSVLEALYIIIIIMTKSTKASSIYYKPSLF